MLSALFEMDSLFDGMDSESLKPRVLSTPEPRLLPDASSFERAFVMYHYRAKCGCVFAIPYPRLIAFDMVCACMCRTRIAEAQDQQGNWFIQADSELAQNLMEGK